MVNINQFAQSTVLGQMDLQFRGSVVTAQVSVNQVTALVAGQPVTVENSAGGLPKVIAAVAGGRIDGYIARSLKDAQFDSQAISASNLLAQSEFEMAGAESALYLTANGAIARFAPVEAVIATPGLVAPWAGINPIVGYAFDAGVTNGDLIRVILRVPTGLNNANAPRTIRVVATLAQINAGLVLIPGVAGKVLTVTDYIARVLGTFATGTAVILESTNVTPVLVTTLAEAGLSTGAVLVPASANTTLGAGFGAPLGSGDGLQVVNSGAGQTAGTSITFDITYLQA